MNYRIAINGLGRIGRSVLRAFYESDCYPEMEIVALNELADVKTLAHLTQYDSTHGRFAGKVSYAGNFLQINSDFIPVSQIENLNDLPWLAHEVDLVLECTGTFSERKKAQLHLQSGAKKVLFSQPAEADVDATVIYGINHHQLKAEHKIISSASCTTNGIVPVIKSIHDALGIKNGMITTLHSAMNDQPVIDAFHHTDLRKTRSAFQSIIPVETGLAKGIERVLPELAGCFQAQALRVPVVNVSAMDMTLVVDKSCSVEVINDIIRTASQTLLTNVLAYTEEPLASCDFNHTLSSSIVDLGQTRVSGGHLVKILTWFDNEWAYANRMLDIAKIIQHLDK